MPIHPANRSLPPSAPASGALGWWVIAALAIGVPADPVLENPGKTRRFSPGVAASGLAYQINAISGAPIPVRLSPRVGFVANITPITPAP